MGVRRAEALPQSFVFGLAREFRAAVVGAVVCVILGMRRRLALEVVVDLRGLSASCTVGHVQANAREADATAADEEGCSEDRGCDDQLDGQGSACCRLREREPPARARYDVVPDRCEADHEAGSPRKEQPRRPVEVWRVLLQARIVVEEKSPLAHDEEDSQDDGSETCRDDRYRDCHVVPPSGVSDVVGVIERKQCAHDLFAGPDS